MEWKYNEPLENPKAIKEFLNKEGLKIPCDVISFIARHNGGRPKKNLFDTDKSKECIFDGVFSYNYNDPECIYNLYEGELKEILNGLKLFPIGMNPSGDLICLKYEDDNSICLFRQESRNVEYIADSISDFEKSFY